MPLFVEPILLDPVPVAYDQRRPAARAEGGVAFLVVHIAGVDIRQAFPERDVSGPDGMPKNAAAHRSPATA